MAKIRKYKRGNEIYTITKYANGNVIIDYPGSTNITLRKPENTFKEAEKRLKRTRPGVTRVYN